MRSYTLEALRLSAVDYLLKPVDEEELKTAITRLRKRVAEKAIYRSLKNEKINSNRLVKKPIKLTPFYQIAKTKSSNDLEQIYFW